MTAITETLIPTGTWSVDPAHSRVEFAVKHMGIATVRGNFGTFEGKLEIGPEGAHASGTVETASINTDEPQRDAHLRSPDFFDAERFPQLSFEAGDISRSGDELAIAGELTLKGHTEPIEIRGHINDPAADPYGGERLGLQLEARVDRTRFGLNWNNPLPSGDPALANEVTIVVDLQLVKEE